MVGFQQPHTIADTENGLNRGNKQLLPGIGLDSEDAGGIDKSVGENAGKNAGGGIENDRIAKADGRGINKLEEGIPKGRAQQEIHDMTHAEGQRRDDNGGSHIGFAHTFE